MKNLILLFMLVACTKVRYQEIPGEITRKPYASALRVDAEEYSQNIDLLVAFLWPERIETAMQRQELQIIISTSRELKFQKEQFQTTRFTLSREYEKADCPCVLEFRCQGNETANDEARCLEIEESIFENDKRLPEIYALVDIMKEKVLGIGGQWLETNQDYPEIPLSTFNFSTLELNLKVFGSVEDLPLEYQFIRPEVLEDVDFQLLSFSAPRKKEAGSWRIEVTPSKTQASLLFQGELYWAYAGVERQGFIYWEHAYIQSPSTDPKK